ncbi:hypothetical protein CLA18_19730 [Pseudomonas protegens]|nr:hypothetical protein CLA18_19730 [Pseudomonas protegens]
MLHKQATSSRQGPISANGVLRDRASYFIFIKKIGFYLEIKDDKNLLFFELITNERNTGMIEKSQTSLTHISGFSDIDQLQVK